MSRIDTVDVASRDGDDELGNTTPRRGNDGARGATTMTRWEAPPRMAYSARASTNTLGQPRLEVLAMEALLV